VKEILGASEKQRKRLLLASCQSVTGLRQACAVSKIQEGSRKWNWKTTLMLFYNLMT